MAEINLSLTEKQFELLQKIFYLGKWMLESHYDDFDKRFSDEQDLEQFIYSKASKDNVMISSDDGRYYPTRKFEEKMEVFIDDYDENIFWDELANRLTERDLTGAMKTKTKILSPEEILEEYNKLMTKYLTEFSKNELANLKIK